MNSKKRSLALITAIAVAALTLAGCASGSEPTSSETAAATEPESGGTLRAIEMAPIKGFDPVQIFSSTSTSLSYSALYGNFLVPDLETSTYSCGLCESFTTDDGGLTWTVVTREGLTFTDGTPFDAAALKYNWDRIKDPANGSASTGFANQIAEIQVVDDVTAKLVMASANPGFLSNFPTYALQWIASPAALAKGTEEFNKNPIGAGPFVFESWTPNGALKVKKNPDYYDSPRPYLDAMEIQGVTDTNQRLNALFAGTADLVLNADAFAFPQAEDAGFDVHEYTFNGGVGLMFNTSKAPFDDVRARQAVSYALDLDKLSDAATSGFPSVPETLFEEDSPYYEDIPLHTYDPEKAQALFDELAEEGNPVSFAFTTTPSPSSQALFDAMQPQLAEYDNVEITSDQRDASEAGVFTTTGDYQLTVSSLAFADPLGRLFLSLHSEAGVSNYSRFNNPAVDEAINTAGQSEDVTERKEQYKIVQEELAVEVPYMLYSAYYNSSLTTDKVQGVTVFGFTSPIVADIWLQQ